MNKLGLVAIMLVGIGLLPLLPVLATSTDPVAIIASGIVLIAWIIWLVIYIHNTLIRK